MAACAAKSPRLPVPAKTACGAKDASSSKELSLCAAIKGGGGGGRQASSCLANSARVPKALPYSQLPSIESDKTFRTTFTRHLQQSATMPKFALFVRANRDAESGVPPTTALMQEMVTFNESLVKAGILVAGEGYCRPRGAIVYPSRARVTRPSRRVRSRSRRSCLGSGSSRRRISTRLPGGRGRCRLRTTAALSRLDRLRGKMISAIR